MADKFISIGKIRIKASNIMSYGIYRDDLSWIKDDLEYQFRMGKISQEDYETTMNTLNLVRNIKMLAIRTYQKEEYKFYERKKIQIGMKWVDISYTFSDYLSIADFDIEKKLKEIDKIINS